MVYYTLVLCNRIIYSINAIVYAIVAPAAYNTNVYSLLITQMSLDTKREEIRKLEEKAHLKEDALLRSEAMLEEDALRFDSFLKENDKKAHDAIKKAEEETRKKQEKVQEVKRLTQKIQSLNSDIVKSKDALDECLRYKSFLDEVTPAHWLEEQRQKHAHLIERERRALYDKKYQEWKQLSASGDDTATVKSTSTSRSALGSANPPPKLEDISVDEAAYFEPYFTQPAQLMEIFAALEEQNLFLIQNCQETEQTLEELRAAYVRNKQMLEGQSSLLGQQIDELQGQIVTEKSKAELLRQKNTPSSSSATAKANKSRAATAAVSPEEESLLKELNDKVKEVYDRCGFETSSRPSAVIMLAQLETKLETLLVDVSKLPPDFVQKSEKEKDKRRREKKREEQQTLLVQQQEDRNRRALERSLQAPKKRTGRAIMFRSRLDNGEAQREKGDNDEANNDEAKYMS